MMTLYLLNFDVYANIDVSPSPLLNDVTIIPRMACHSLLAVATTIKPVAFNKHANVIRTLNVNREYVRKKMNG